jgi:hypothetical protein
MVPDVFKEFGLLALEDIGTVFYQLLGTTHLAQREISEDLSPQHRHCENLGSHSVVYLLHSYSNISKVWILSTFVSSSVATVFNLDGAVTLFSDSGVFSDTVNDTFLQTLQVYCNI